MPHTVFSPFPTPNQGTQHTHTHTHTNTPTAPHLPHCSYDAPLLPHPNPPLPSGRRNFQENEPGNRKDMHIYTCTCALMSMSADEDELPAMTVHPCTHTLRHKPYSYPIHIHT